MRFLRSAQIFTQENFDSALLGDVAEWRFW